MKYDHIDFLEFFDSEKVIDEEAGYMEYAVACKDSSLRVFMNVYDDNAYFIMSTETTKELIALSIRNIEEIVCDKSDNNVRFLFYKYDKYVPLACLYIKPSLSLSLDIEHEEDVTEYPYRAQNR